MTSSQVLSCEFSDLSGLGEAVKKNADILALHAVKGGTLPSLAIDGDSLIIDKAERDTLRAKSELLTALKQLQSLVKGPLANLMDIGANDILCLQAICRFKIAQAMGKEKELPFEELSKRCGLNLKDLQRILRYAMTNFIFCEPRPGVVRHTLISQQLAQDNLVRDYVENVCEVRFPASVCVVDALEKYGFSQHPFESGFSLSRDTTRGLYDELARDPHEARRWDGAMSALALQIDIDWIHKTILGVTTANDTPLIVDVGGGRGSISIGLAERLPNASFVVQDTSSTALMQGKSESLHLGSRVQFQTYDFRTKQHLEGADIYYFKNIFHNWPDASCIEILRNQIPALKPGAHVFIDDFTLHEPGTLIWPEERKRRWMDINMLVFFGSRERSISDWKDLLLAADRRFDLVGMSSAADQHNSILRVKWTPSH